MNLVQSVIHLHTKDNIAPLPLPKMVSILLQDPETTEVVFTYDDNLSDNGLIEYARKNPNISSITLESCYRITDLGLMGLIVLPGIGNHLKSLHIFGMIVNSTDITDNSLRALGFYCRGLTSLRLSFCYSITDVGISELVKYCRGLEVIELYWCKLLTDLTVKEIAQSCSSLREINLTSCFHITDVGILELANGCPRLTSVNLGHCSQVTDTSIKILAQKCPLRSVDLRFCVQLTNEAICILLDNCSGLDTLCLDDCSQITDITVFQVAEKCPRLSSLSLNHCCKITNQALEAIIHNCPLLIETQLYECPEISIDMIERIDIACEENYQVARVRPRFAALRIHRFWRDVCYDPTYGYARKQLVLKLNHTGSL